MKVSAFLQEKRSTIQDRWFQCMLECFPEDASGFLKKERNPFANPIGGNFRKGIDVLFDFIASDCQESVCQESEIVKALDRIVRIRAVQDFGAAQAVEFIFQLKKVLREALKTYSIVEFDVDDILQVESRIDRLALLAFDNYMECREKIYEIKANQVRNMSYKLLQRSGAFTETNEVVNEPCGQSGHHSCGMNGGCEV